MLPQHLAHLGLTEPERELRYRLLGQCDVWITRHAHVMYAALRDALIEHGGCAELPPPQLRIEMRADLMFHEPCVSIVGSITFDAQGLNP